MSKSISRRIVLAVPLTAAAVGVTSCGFGNSTNPNQNQNQNNNTPGAGKGTDTLRIAMRPVNHLNPAFGGGGSPEATIIAAWMWEGLVVRDPDDTQNYLPGAAEKWESSADGLTHTFHLRSGAKWSNGDPLTANDFVYAFSYYYSPKLTQQGDKNPPMFNGSATNTNIKGLTDYFTGVNTDFSSVGVKAKDDVTVEFTLTAPDYRFIDSLVRTYPLHKSSVEANLRDFWMPGKAVTNGPYNLDKYTQNSGATLTVNPNYWDAKSLGVKTLEAQFNSSGSTGMMVTYNANEIDIFRVDGDPTALIAGRPDLEKELQRGTLVQFKGIEVLPTKNAILQEKPKIREALAWAIDREALAKVSPPDVAGPSWVPEGISGADKLPKLGFDVAKAKQLLAEAGHADGKGIPPLQILTYASMPSLEAICSMWKENLGINAKVSVQEVGVYGNMLNGDLPDDFVGFAFNYQAPTPFNMVRYGGSLYFSNIFLPFDIKKQWFDLQYGKDKGSLSGLALTEKLRKLEEDNWFPEYKAFVTQMKAAQDAQANPEEATRLATEAAITFQNTHYWIPLLWAGYTFMVKPRIKGMKLTSYPDNIVSLKGVKLDPLA